ncbi:hypothetical protein [Nonomuraea sp. NPDC050783]|uniref:hypothetical protein n=1 Tax=Nonomuraea sp. NPDC050783 TaxID=3154634 RepID=UPI0034650F96
MIVLSAGLGVLLLLGGGYGVISHLRAAATARPPAVQPRDTPPAPWDSAGPSEPAPPSATPTGAPADGGTTHAAPGSPISNSEFGDWRFKAGTVRFEANKAGGWTYDTCDPVDARGVLAEHRCERAVQIAYSAYRGHLKAVQVVMAFPTGKRAEDAAKRLAKLTTGALNIRQDKVRATYAYGKVRTNAIKKYVIVTIVTADRTARAKAPKFHLYLQADTFSYFLLRDTTVTS